MKVLSFLHEYMRNFTNEKNSRFLFALNWFAFTALYLSSLVFVFNLLYRSPLVLDLILYNDEAVVGWLGTLGMVQKNHRKVVRSRLGFAIRQL